MSASALKPFIPGALLRGPGATLGSLPVVGFALLAALSLAGCRSDNQTSPGASPLVGTWVSETCAPVTVGGGDPEGRLTAYEFTTNGRILWERYAYDDADCATGETLAATSEDDDVVVLYADLGLETLQEGTLGHRLRVRWRQGTATIRDRQDIFVRSVTGSRICTSRNLAFRGNDLVWSAEAGTAIDFEHCLVRGVLPGPPFCDDPAPLGGEPAGAGFIVYFEDGVSAQDEVQRLAGLYEFEVILVYSDPGGFAATMSNFTMESLRCEASVESVFHNGPAGGG